MPEAFWKTINLLRARQKGEKVSSTSESLLRVRKLRSTLRTAKSKAELGLGEEHNSIPSRAVTMEIKRKGAIPLCRAGVQQKKLSPQVLRALSPRHYHAH